MIFTGSYYDTGLDEMRTFLSYAAKAQERVPVVSESIVESLRL